MPNHDASTPSDNSQDDRVTSLLRAREARGLRWAIRARLAYIVVGVVLISISSPTLGDLLFSYGLCVFAAAINLLTLSWVKRQQHLNRSALIGLTLDILVIVALPISWYQAVGGPEAQPFHFLVKSDLLFIVFVVLAYNTLALRPKDPLIVGGAALLQQVVFLILALADSRTVLTDDPVAAHMGADLHLGFLAGRAVSVVLVSGFLAAAAKAARTTIRRSVAMEVENASIKAQRARAVNEGNLSAFSRLVAGVSHELNTPLGAILSTADTSAQGVSKLRDTLKAAEPSEPLTRKTDRLLQLLETGTATTSEAATRIHRMVNSLRDFSHLDRATETTTDVHRGIDATLDLIPAEHLSGVTLVKAYGALPPVLHQPQQVNQVILTLVTNALDALAGQGTLEIRTARKNDAAIIQVRDTGPGIDPAVLKTLFELRFDEKAQRLGMGLGLPVGHVIAQRHGGDLSCTSVVGEGTTFELTLPFASKGSTNV